MLAARQAGASPWEVHERAFTGEFAPAKPYDLRSFFWTVSRRLRADRRCRIPRYPGHPRPLSDRNQLL